MPLFVSGCAPCGLSFADEVEMSGYSPTLPNIARQGILVLGSSNQYALAQLADELMPPRIYRFTGDDMRLGDPADALVDDEDAAWELFERARQRRYTITAVFPITSAKWQTLYAFAQLP